MAIILNIETSGKYCSATLSEDGGVLIQKSDDKEMSHSVALGPFVEDIMNYLERQEKKLDAVAVSIGPGSYTGLRIGLSMAKGICFGKDIPLIGVSTLEILAVKAMFLPRCWSGEEILVPMIDARRMEVFTASYNFALEALEAPRPLILDSESYLDSFPGKTIVLIGDGASKAKDVMKRENVITLVSQYQDATDMIALSEKAYRENRFLDVAYSVPEYLKAYQTTSPKNQQLKNC